MHETNAKSPNAKTPGVKSLAAIRADPAMLALGALGWILTDADRAARMLDLTGLTPDILRGGVSENATLAAILSFLEAHEPDLIAAADYMGASPEALVHARMELEA